MDESGGFGPHLMLDLKDCDPAKLRDLDMIWDLLNDFPEAIGMTKIIPPYVFKYNGLVPEDKGITGMVIIAESHITVHTFEEKGYAFLDVFSCKPFDYERARNYLVEAFGCQSPTHQVAFRGLDFPRSEAMSGQCHERVGAL